MAEHSVTLPGGLIAGEGGPLLSEVKLRALSGHEEDWLARHTSAPSAVKTTRLLSSCVVSVGGTESAPDLVRRMLVGDRDYLVLELRRLTLGDELQIVLACPECGAKMDVSLDASEAPVERRPEAWKPQWMQVGERQVCFRLPSGEDQEAVLGLEPENAVAALFERCLVSDGGSALTEEERAAVIGEMGRRAPGVEIELDLTCPDCGHAFVTPFDTTAFFFQEMRVQSAQLLREVHGLAFYYHWSESEILSLERERRRQYLSILNEALRRD